VPSPARHHRGPECLPNARWLEQQTLGLQGDPANRVDGIGSQVIPTIQDVFGPTLKPGGTPVLHGDVERTSLERARASNSRLPTLPYSITCACPARSCTAPPGRRSLSIMISPGTRQDSRRDDKCLGFSRRHRRAAACPSGAVDRTVDGRRPAVDSKRDGRWACPDSEHPIRRRESQSRRSGRESRYSNGHRNSACHAGLVP
jgi:hypothetical protein